MKNHKDGIGPAVMAARDIINKLELEPLPGEGGYFRQTWKSGSGTAIYFLLTPGENGFSALHELTEVEIYHFYVGDPVQLVLFPPDEPPREIILGSGLDRGEIPQFIVPGGTVQGSRLVSGGQWALMGTTMAPGYSPEGFRLIPRTELLDGFPNYHEWIMALTRKEDDL